MTLWLDAQLSPRLAPWMAATFQLEVRSLRWRGFRDEEDDVIFQKARESAAIIVTKDSDFCELLRRHGSPPKLIWITCVHCRNSNIQHLLTRYVDSALSLLANAEEMIEIGDLDA